jgi:geranylgeranyl diphosphate synthase type II
MEFEHRKEVLPGEYIEMIRLKTAVLLGCSLKTGAIIGGASEKDAEYLYDFGINTGLAFQLKDDLLDVYGNPETFGKQVGGDILCNKKTYLLIHAKKAAQGALKTRLNYWLDTPDSEPEMKIREVTDIYNQLGVKKVCEDAMSSYYEKAIASLENVSVLSNKKQELRKLAEKLMFRND